MRPFVFRKYLDYGTLEAMRRLHAEVRRDVARRELAEHVKLGPGGIREIEFIAQALQLIRGGRDPELTARPTLQCWMSCCRKRLLPGSGGRSSPTAYVFLRNVEHRLQYLDDAQTHELPDDARRPRAPRADGGFRRLGRVLRRARTRTASAVTRHFQAVFAEPGAESEAQALARASAPGGAAREPALRCSCPTTPGAASTR